MANLRTFVLQRLALIPVTIFFILTIVFYLLRVLPGANPIRAIAPQLPQSVIEARTKALGLDKPIWEQYLDYLNRVIHLNFGTSIAGNADVATEVIHRFGATLELTIVALLIGIPLGIFIGTYGGRWRETKRDHLLRVYSIAFFAIPIFLFGIYIQQLFGVLTTKGGVGWIPPNSRTSGGVASAIPKLTGVFMFDSLIFSGTTSLFSINLFGNNYVFYWEFIYLFFGICIYLCIIIIWWYHSFIKRSQAFLLDQDNQKPNWKIPKLFARTLVIYLLSCLIVLKFGLLVELFQLEFLGIILVPIFVFFLVLGLAIWPLTLTYTDISVRPYYKIGVIIGLVIACIPLIFYFYSAWFTPRFQVRSSESLVTSLYLFLDVVRHLLLPGLALGLLISSIVSRVIRQNMIITMNESYIDSSRARGIPERKITYDYAMKNATVPAIPLLGLQFALLLSGAILTETTFSFPGLGYYLFQALTAKDYPEIQGAIIFLAMNVAIVSFITDVVYAFVDPRVRL